MVHIGEPAFYRTVFDDAYAHDIVLIEGLNSPITTRVTRSYRWLIGSDRIGLSLQPHGPKAGACNATIVHADLSGAEFAEEWRKVPLWLRLAVYLIAPLLGIQRRWFGTRQSLAKDLSVDDQPSVRELVGLNPETGALTQAILHSRDERLLHRLRQQLSACEGRSMKIAIVYGAAHMRAVVRELVARQGYMTAGSDWLTVFHI